MLKIWYFKTENLTRKICAIPVRENLTIIAGFKKVNRQHTKAAERYYYLTAGNAIEFDERSGLTSNMERYDDISKRIRRVLDSGMLLDIGCGTARMFIAVAKAIPELKLVGIDVSEAMIDIGKKHELRKTGKSAVKTDAAIPRGWKQSFRDDSTHIVEPALP